MKRSKEAHMDPFKPINQALNNLKTIWSNFTPKSSSSVPDFNSNPPFCSLSSYFPWKKKNEALTTAEIMERMAGIPVYRLTNCHDNVCGWQSDHDPDTNIQLYHMNKTDAQGENSVRPALEIHDAPLHHIVQFEDQQIPLVRLVPESSQIKNAIELRKKNSYDFVDRSFPGVPVFQSEYMAITNGLATYRPAYFRKEDLEKAMIPFVKPENRDKIKVAAFEEIIQEMKDGSTSESNDVFFIAPGITSWTWISSKHISI